MKKFLVFMLVVCSIGGMYYFSSQDAQVSGSQSQLVVRFIDKIRDKVTLQDEKLINIGELTNRFIFCNLFSNIKPTFLLICISFLRSLSCHSL